jgi:hypothetical protein
MEFVCLLFDCKYENFVLIKHGVYADRSLKLIDTVLHRFSLEQLVDVVFPELKILSWTSIRSKIIEERLPLNKNSVIRFMVLAIEVIHVLNTK